MKRDCRDVGVSGPVSSLESDGAVSGAIGFIGGPSKRRGSARRINKKGGKPWRRRRR